MTLAYGIDVSKWQKRVDWDRVVLQGCSFAFIKASQSSFEDPLFRTHWSNAKRSGIIRGAYHFFVQDVDPLLQARTLLDVLGADMGELPPVVDVEYERRLNKTTHKVASVEIENPQKYAADLKLFLTEVEACTRKRPIIYTAKGFWDNVMRIRGSFPAWASTYPLWVANYLLFPYKQRTLLTPENLASISDGASRGIYRPVSMPKSWNQWTFWQCSGDRYYLDGIDTADKNGDTQKCSFDLNLFYGTLDELRAYAKVDVASGDSETGVHYVDIRQYTNQKVIAAFIMAFGSSGAAVLEETGMLYHLQTVPSSLYEGPQIQDIPNLSYDQELALNSALLRQISNQKMINAFYKAFGALEYWNVVIRAGLEYLADHRQDPYIGPEIDLLPLTVAEKEALKAVFPI